MRITEVKLGAQLESYFKFETIEIMPVVCAHAGGTRRSIFLAYRANDDANNSNNSSDAANIAPKNI
ncbi:MAG: hypothetical protein HUJ51_05120 [Eggerthellaceae bacterium]|nr:hypothetical protein [Eggerthellaceae bacterium]